jgi:hypothetical protein
VFLANMSLIFTDNRGGVTGAKRAQHAHFSITEMESEQYKKKRPMGHRLIEKLSHLEK